MRIADAEGRAYSEILNAIATQKYAPGDHLAEAKVAEELNMSRTPVRNALKKMIASGMLEYVRNVGCRIPFLTPDDMENVFLTRIELEAQAAGLATRRASEAEIENLFLLLEQERDFYARREAALYANINKELHLGIASLSKNTYLERFISQAFWRSSLYVLFFDRFYYREQHSEQGPLREPNESQSCREHHALVKAIAAGNADLAASLMRAHVTTTYETIVRRNLLCS